MELIGGVEKHAIVIADYDPGWPDKFETQRRIIAAALRAAAMRIEHIGSTSVPGLAAKPIIDVLVVVADPSAGPTALRRYQAHSGKDRLA